MPKALTNISAIVILTLIGIFVCYIHYFSFDFPYQDDVTLLEFINSTQNTPWNWSHFFQSLFRVDNDHSIVIPRLITWVDYLIFGQVNFQHLILVTLGELILILYLLYRLFKRQQIHLVYFIPVAFLWLQPQYHEVSNWAITGLQHGHVTLFLLASLLFITEDKAYALAWAITLAFLASFTFGNGFIVFIALAYVYLLQKNWKNALIVGICLMLFFACYLQIYQMGQAAKFHWNINHILFSFLGFIGASAMEFPKIGLVLSWFIGFLVVSIFIFYSIDHGKFNLKNKDQGTYLGILTFILFSAGLIALVRSAENYTIYSRFQLYAALSIIIVYLHILLHTNKRFHSFLLIGTLLYCIPFYCLSFFNHSIAQQYQKMSFLADRINWKNNQCILSVSSGFLWNAKPIILEAENNRVYSMNYPWDNPFQHQEAISLPKESLTFQAKEYKEIMRQKHATWINHYYWLEFQHFPFSTEFKKQWFIILQSTNQHANSYILPIQFALNGKKNFLSMENYRANYGSIKINHESLKAGNYEMYLWNLDPENPASKNRLYALKQLMQVDTSLHTLKLN
ncbi:hypothetical protein EWU23_03385 [Cytophagaceae bacterium 50C-KIRBA]|uniref:Glycosyltransferase RgtA/B/C/D-like domain-containing protein n=1 Tax=Aquirufa beregesia TaxID=2516556 RepID=A0ABX0ESV0_9BACT|nr:hypothetical protein [Aquirufa beregesia]NGZ43511.1 hypothetical protein [Aquirufa beregesia]